MEIKKFNNQQQMDLALDEAQQYSLKNVFKQAWADIRAKFPQPVEDETLDEYVEFLYIETLLEVSERIKKIALMREKKKINVLYGKD